MSSSSYPLPREIFCPVCGEKVKTNELDRKQAFVAGAIRSAKFACGCGTGGVFSLRKTAEGYVMYSMTFYIYPARAEKANVVDVREWLRKMGSSQLNTQYSKRLS